MRHYMTPVTGGITNREENWLIAVLRLRQRFGSPRPPIDRIVLVLQEIRTALGGETIVARPGKVR